MSLTLLRENLDKMIKKIQNSNTGFTIVEMLIGILVGTIILLGLTKYLSTQTAIQGESNRKKGSIQLTKEIIDAIQKDFKNAQKISFNPKTKGITLNIRGKLKRYYSKCINGQHSSAKSASLSSCRGKCSTGKVPVVVVTGSPRVMQYPQNIGLEGRVIGPTGAALCASELDKIITVKVEAFYDTGNREIKKVGRQTTYTATTSNPGVIFQQ